MKSNLFVKFQNFRSQLNNAHLERTVVIDGLLACIIAKQNSFLLGLPGTGKSDLVRSICSGFLDAKYFSYLLSPTTDPSELFGPVAVSKLLKDEYTRDTEGYLPASHIVFLDELFRGSSAILNSLLPLLNERTFNNGKAKVDTPIKSIIAATNTWPDEESLQAFGDRFLFRPTVEKLQKPTSQSRLDKWALDLIKRPEVECRLNLQDLESLQVEAQKMPVADDFLDKYTHVWSLLKEEGIEVSDRRRVQILKFMQAWALVQGDDKVYPDHLPQPLPHIVYKTDEDQDTIKEVLRQAIPSGDTLLKDAQKAYDNLVKTFVGIQKRLKDYNVTSVESLNESMVQLKRTHERATQMESHLERYLTGSDFRITATIRAKITSLMQNINTFKDSIANTLQSMGA
jgi:MoxR-like ATPase